ncbi:MAG: phenylalanine--tRNA ligase subunit beta [Burkholderiales bacterium]|jgi:phenylalanyl-tRNA synthetase beta chain|nr:phenylalanine--tRNA ligase subunit beta [Burkholderiales bacterium]
MRFSERWLRTLINPPLTTEALCDCLTTAGLEVEETSLAAPPFSGVVVARIIDVSPHPNADRLQVCIVDTGVATPLQIVCGAPNAAAGLVVPCALEGAELPSGMKVKRTKMRGVESQGMLCSARELGISDDHSGLLALPSDWKTGESIRAALGLDDTYITLKLTPNRADCLSLLGVAREIAAFTRAEIEMDEVSPIVATSDLTPSITIEAPEACPRFASRIIDGIDPSASTPLWMEERLRSAGVRPISPLVDVTNYVMLELGQPMHAYDCARLEGGIVIRFAQQGEKLLLLNEQTLDLSSDLLLVCDEKKPLGLAGIMGGEYSGIGAETSRVLLEAAYWSPDVIQGRMRRLGFVSDAGYRFERGVDFELPPIAIERATELILEICGGVVGPLVDVKGKLPERPPVRVRTARVSRLLGWTFCVDDIDQIFTRLGFAFQRDGEDLIVTPPSYRFDLVYEEDFIEEIVRLYGYDNIPMPEKTHAQHMLSLPEAQLPAEEIRARLTHQGWQEIITFSFVASETERLIHGADFVAPVRVHNPIAAQYDVMRVSLLSGLLEVLKTNLSRKEPYLRLFEIGRVFHAAIADHVSQPYRVGGLAYGLAQPEQWGTQARAVDFFDVKGTLETLVAPRKLTTETFHDGHTPYFLHPRRSARVLAEGRDLGWLGELHPRLIKEMDLPAVAIAFELDYDLLLASSIPQASPISRQPMARRDLAIVVDKNLPAQKLLDTLEKIRPPHVENVQIFDVYQGTGMPEGKKSVAILMLMRDTEKTLTERDIDETVKQFFIALEKEHSAVIRT